MPEVLLIFDGDCPNVVDCRTNLIKAFAASGEKPSWDEIDRSSDDAPLHVRGFGSPTVLVNGSDVAGLRPALNGPSCRLYRTENREYVGVPSVEEIAASLCEAFQENGLFDAQGTGGCGWKRSLPLLLSVGVALLPSITCPSCWPGYAAVLSSFGIGFLPSNRYVLPLTVTFLVIYLLMLMWDAHKRQRFGPLLISTVATTLLIVGRFILESDQVLHAGVALLISASIWNSWPAIKTKWFALQQTKTGCPACQSAVQITVTKSRNKDLTPDLGTDGRL